MDELEEANEDSYNLYYGENYDEEYDDTEMRIKKLGLNQQAKEADINPSKEQFSDSNKQQKKLLDVQVTGGGLSTTTSPMCDETEADDLMINSNKYFNSLQHFQFGPASDERKKANDLFTTSYGEGLNSANNGANLFVLLATKRNTSESRANLYNNTTAETKLNTMQTPVKNHSTSNFLSPASNNILNLYECLV